MAGAEKESRPLQDGDFEKFKPVIGQIAHDFNNLLTPLMAYPELIRKDLPEGSRSFKLIESIEQCAGHMVHITRQLMMLSERSPSAGKTIFDLGHVVEQALRQVRTPSLPERIEFRVNLGDEGSPVDAVAEDVLIAVRNILNNAVESVGESGVITVSTARMRSGAPLKEDSVTMAPGEYVVLTVKDTGTGIDEDIADRIFEPFVSTKKGGSRRGAGLGLSVAYRVARNNDGYLVFNSAKGQGTVFRMFLPARPDAPKPDVVSAGGPAPCDKSRVLVVDDDERVRKLFLKILGSSLPGIKVSAADSGENAVKSFTEARHAAIVLDLHMTGMDGVSVFNEIVRLCEDNNWAPPRVLFCTGYAPPDAVTQIVESGSGHYLLRKPVSVEVLVGAVKRFLEP